MKHSRIKGILLFVSMQFLIEARTVVTPLILRRGALSKIALDLEHKPWHLELWTAGYHRSAQKAYSCAGGEVPLTTLFFNKSDFRVTDVLPELDTPLSKNPLAALSVLKPRISYKESGAFLGLDAVTHIKECWRVGLRGTLPIQSIRIKTHKSATQGNSTLGGLTLADVLAEKPEIINGSPIKSYAFRLDVLSKLPYSCTNGPGSTLPIVQYADPDFPPNNPITISNQDITNQQGTPVSALKSSKGTLPPEPWALQADQAQALPIIDAQGLIPTSRGRFDASVSYDPLGADPAQQSTLFIVPSVAEGRTTPDSRVIEQQVDELRACLDGEAEDTFTACGISFTSKKVTGIGDVDTEFYGGYLFSSCAYLEGFAGIRWPTGKRTHCPQDVFQLPLGNNGHYEFKAGIQGLWRPCRWALLHADFTGFYVARKSESVAATFKNSAIKNIGLPVRADIHWHYYLFHTELLVTTPSYSECGALIGYELYHKGYDSLRLCAVSALDCVGTERTLDGEVLRQGTQATSHKLRGEVFLKASDCLNLFAGGSKVIRGKNVPQEGEFYAGLSFYY